jgi:hypothetical protein
MTISLFFGIFIAFSFWENGLLDFSYTTSLYETTSYLEESKSRDDIGLLYDFASDNKIKESLKHLSLLEKNITNVSLISNNKNEYLDLKKVIGNIKDYFLGVSSFSDMYDARKVLLNKLDKFRGLTEDKKWNNLNRIVSKMIEKVESLEGFNQDKLRQFIRFINQDVQLIKKISESAGLNSDLNTISLRVQSFSTELIMIKSYIEQKEKLLLEIRVLEKKYIVWRTMMIDELTTIKMDRADYQKKIMTLFTFFLGTMLIFLLFGLIYAHSAVSGIITHVENFSLNIIKKNLLSRNIEKDDSYGQSYYREIEKIQVYLQRKLSFGQLFQNALPFPCVLLDSSQKVIWANSLFCDLFKLENVDLNQKYLTWDFLLKYTNLGDTDPVPESLMNDLNGIYQVLVKVEREEAPRPFEMYLVPEKINGDKYIMIYFYSLVSLQETIRNQCINLVAPIKESLSILKDTRSHDHLEGMEAVFRDHDIFDVYEDIKSVAQLSVMEKDLLLKNVQNLESKVQDYEKMMNDLKTIFSSIKDFNHGYGEGKINFKKHIIGTLGVLERKNKLIEESISGYHELLGHMKEIGKEKQSLVNCLFEVKQNLFLINQSRQEIKNNKNQIVLLFQKINQLFDQMMLFQDDQNEAIFPMMNGLMKLRVEFRALSKEVSLFDKNSLTLDVQTSKTMMIMDTPDKNGDHSPEQIDFIKQSFLRKMQGYIRKEEEIIDEQKTIEKEYLPIQENIVRYVQESFYLFKQYLYLFKSAESLLAFSTLNEEEQEQGELLKVEDNHLLDHQLINTIPRLENVDATI